MLPIQAEELAAETTRINLPVPDPYVHEAPRQITGEEREFEAFRTLRTQRGFARNEGKRKLREAKVRNLIFLGVGHITDKIIWEHRRLRRRLTRRSKLSSVVLLLFASFHMHFTHHHVHKIGGHRPHTACHATYDTCALR